MTAPVSRRAALVGAVAIPAAAAPATAGLTAAFVTFRAAVARVDQMNGDDSWTEANVTGTCTEYNEAIAALIAQPATTMAGVNMKALALLAALRLHHSTMGVEELPEDAEDWHQLAWGMTKELLALAA